MGVRLSPKWGVNPTITTCWYCGKESGLALLGRVGENRAKEMGWEKPYEGAPYDVKAPRFTCLGPAYPCEECEKAMKIGVMLISITNDSKPPTATDEGSITRSGAIAIVSDDFVKEAFGDLAESALKRRFSFVTDKAWDTLGLPRGEIESSPSSLSEFLFLSKLDEKGIKHPDGSPHSWEKGKIEEIDLGGDVELKELRDKFVAEIA